MASRPNRTQAGKDQMQSLDSHIAEQATPSIDPALSLTHTLREAARHGEPEQCCSAPFRRRSRCCWMSCCGSTRAPGETVRDRDDRHGRPVRADAGDLEVHSRTATGSKIEVVRRERAMAFPWSRTGALLLGGQGGRPSSAALQGSRGMDHGHPPRAGSRPAPQRKLDRAGREAWVCGSTTRWPTGPTRTSGGRIQRA